MRKFYGIIIMFFVIYLMAWKVAKADDYSTAVLGHVIQNANIIDKEELMKQELANLAHKNSIELISILQAYLPAILDGIAADLRMKSDLQYKCSLQGENYKNKECQ